MSKEINQKLEELRSEAAFHLYDIETMITIGEEVALGASEQKNPKIEWLSVFSILKKLYKPLENNLQEMDKLITQERIREQKKENL